ncbi:MAG: hypothetical protein sL5_08680 [Candidatus Mesenet longicola]|uniref:Uncharacterized protein n=1 Tax=Candidatus Mesenet longicola TaxID=1892558 RepID=A0A8J3HVV8_9RICK|nr:MAG: hypothetical protein sGL2_08980 [Candidatus Mesenet longicola]GHM59875.1 MAG: hypothetical protein sL5_08680 [Candidatus Mesenet longicola]
MNGVNSNTIIKEQISGLLQAVQNMPDAEKTQLFQLLKEAAQTPEMADITGATKEQSSHYMDSGVKKLASNNMSKDEMSNTVSKSTDFVNSSETQDKISRNKDGLGNFIDELKTLSTGDKLLSVMKKSAITLTKPLHPVVALVALTVAALGLGGMAIGKGMIKAGKAVAHGAQVAGSATVHGMQIAGNAIKSGAEATKRRMSDAAEVISDKSEHAAKKAKHGLKNVVDHVPSRTSNIEDFLKNASRSSREFGSLSSESEGQVYFIKEYLLQDGKISDKKVQALENVLNNEVNESEVQNFHRLIEKGKSTHRNDYEEFKNQLNGLTSIMQDKELQNAFTSELAKVGKQERKSEIKEEKAEEQPSSFISNIKDRISSIATQQQVAR